jgi:hypothetical protein
MSYRQQIQDAIDKYAVAYNELENLQKKPQEDSKLIPEGDQKTGAIGEYYAMQYCQKKYPKKGTKISFGNHSQAGWDIEVKEPGKKSFKIQVKTVSAFAAGLKTTPIKILGFSMAPVKASVIDLVKIKEGKEKIKILEPWNELFIIYLNKCFLPIGFWIFEPEAFKDKELNKGFNLTLPKVMEDGKKFVGGSPYFAGANPINDEYWDKVLDEALGDKDLYGCLDENEVIEKKGD